MKNYYLYKEGLDGSENGKELELILSDTAEKISSNLNDIFHKDINYYWSRKDTFCYFFTDYPSKREQWLIGTGEINLSKYLREKYYCVLFSRDYEKKFSCFQYTWK